MIGRALAIGALGLLATALASLAAPAPPPTPWLGRTASACPLGWRPGEPPGLFPHPAAPAGERGGALADASGGSAAAAARGWLEVRRPERALAALAAAPETADTRLYRMAALRGLERWSELAGELARAGAVPGACGPLLDRWSAEAAAATGQAAAAERAWARLAGALPELGAYVDLWRLEAAAAGADLATGEVAWARLAGGRLPEVAMRDARAALGRLYERAGRPAAARTWYLAAAEGEPSGIRRGELWLAAADQAERAGERGEADRLRARTVTREPAAAAELLLDPAIRARMGIPALDAARALFAAGRPEPAETFATAAVESGSGEGEKDARLLRAEIRAARGDRAGAEADYAAFLARWPADPRTPEVVYDRARLALRFDDGATARSRLQEFLSRYPGDRRASSAVYLIADSYQDDRRLDPAHADRAIEVFDRVAREHSGSTFADRAYMRAAHLSFALGRVAEAERRYVGYRGSQSAREARYWRARALERRGDAAGARGILAALAGGEDYYALLSRDRLRGRPTAVLLEPAGGPGPVPPYRGADAEVLADPAGRTAAALLAFGEREYAAAELERAVARLGGDRARLEAWAIALADWGFPGVTLQIGVRLGGERHPLAYPAGFATAVEREAAAHGLDPWYVLALIRQESLYDADVVSPADARGLMQILPATGREIADSLGWGEFDERDLFEPAVNLHFGARYLEVQSRRFDGFWPAMLAAYNGGPHVVARWWSFPERTQDPELWVERIPYKETRDYVKKIAAQRARYRSLHAPSAASR